METGQQVGCIAKQDKPGRGVNVPVGIYISLNPIYIKKKVPPRIVLPKAPGAPRGIPGTGVGVGWPGLAFVCTAP